MDLSQNTVSLYLRHFRLKVHFAVTKSFMSKNNQKAALTFAEEHVVWTEDNWSRFTLYMRASLFVSDVKHYVRRQKRERLKKSEKWRGRSIMVFPQRELGLLYSYVAGWLQMFTRTSLSSMPFLFCEHLTISLQIHARKCFPLHCKTGKTVP